MFKRVLLAIDGSPASFHAARLGVELASVHGATAIGVFVTAPLEMPEVFPDAAALDSAAREHYRECVNREAEAHLDEVAMHARNAHVAWHSMVVNNHSPALALIAAAADRHADLIVAGAQGRGMGEGLPLGSTVAKVLALACVPVLLVRDPEPSIKGAATSP